VEFIFITLDPERDTPERMAEYLPVFDAKIVGLTGEMDELGEVWRDFGLIVRSLMLEARPVICWITRPGHMHLIPRVAYK
jgi:protein SCO1